MFFKRINVKWFGRKKEDKIEFSLRVLIIWIILVVVGVILENNVNFRTRGVGWVENRGRGGGDRVKIKC